MQNILSSISFVFLSLWCSLLLGQNTNNDLTLENAAQQMQKIERKGRRCEMYRKSGKYKNSLLK